MRKRTEVLVASVVAGVVTFLGVRVLTASPSTRPELRGCGEHAGLVVAGGTDVSAGGQRRTLVQGWRGAGGERASLVEVGTSSDEQRSQLAAAEEARSCAYDVLILDAPWVAEFAQRGFLDHVDPAWVADADGVFPAVYQAGAWKGTQYAVPWNTDAGLLYARKGTPAPANWRDLLATGYASQLADYEGLTVNALEVLWNTEGLVLTGAVDKVSVETAAGIILPGLRQLAANRAAGDSRSYKEAETLGAFVGGDTTSNRRWDLMRHWPYAFRNLTADPRVHGAFGVGPLPGPGYSVLGGQYLAVSRFSKHAAEAGRLVRELTGVRSEQRLFACGGFAATRQAAFEDPNCQGASKDPDVPTAAELASFAATLKTALRTAHPRPVTPYYEQFSETFRQCVLNVLDGHAPSAKTVADALNTALTGHRSDCSPAEK
ncbi:extracellular solute-binding protein [Actinomadura sp. DC4]|uniref:extracellular solute-binding protein n=1 Tax=Actinomadura sp. DC4 TaxID=3055069 RepID=UPI0025B13D2B|nr:extracellular solute-binding protein [Actinomadura sp. DC4]MDN3354391.1 extracellular solute-binding protein [Actinomadura sp. DC4]